ncbi:glycosyltransferase [Vibrio lentus]
MVEKKRVIIVQNSVKTVFLFRFDYIKRLCSDYEVIVIAPNDDNSSRDYLRGLGVFVYNIPYVRSFLGLLFSAFLMNILIVVERFKGGRFICHFISTFIMCFFTLLPLNKKLIVYTEGLGSAFSKEGFFRKCARFLLMRKNITRLFCNLSERETLGYEFDVVTGGIGVDISKFDISEVNTQLDKNKTFIISYVGRLIKDKGVLDAISVLRELRSEGVEVKLILAGDIYAKNPSSLSETDITNLEIEFGNSIEFLGFVDNIIDVYRYTDVLLLPSAREGFPVCVMEANAMGIPCVGYDVPGVSDAISIGENGLLANYRDKKQLSGLVCSLLNRGTLDKYRSSCVVYAKNNFSNIDKSEFLLDIIKGL